MRYSNLSDITTTIESITSNPNQLCLVNRCLNGGFCLTVPGGGFRCICTTGFTGLLCDYSGSLTREIETEISVISFLLFKDRPTITGCGLSNPCLNSGVCISSAIGYQCQCIDNFGGSNCQSSSGIRTRVRIFSCRLLFFLEKLNYSDQ
jgi:hypothetical protein